MLWISWIFWKNECVIFECVCVVRCTLSLNSRKDVFESLVGEIERDINIVLVRIESRLRHNPRKLADTEN